MISYEQINDIRHTFMRIRLEMKKKMKTEEGSTALNEMRTGSTMLVMKMIMKRICLLVSE